MGKRCSLLPGSESSPVFFWALTSLVLQARQKDMRKQKSLRDYPGTHGGFVPSLRLSPVLADAGGIRVCTQNVYLVFFERLLSSP